MKTTESNDLRYQTHKHIMFDGKPSTIYVKIRLNDECKNGHQDFSITGDIYANQNGNKSDRHFITGGCIHEEILKFFPEFKIFVDLHLCDFNGAPMYPEANGLYFIQNGFERLKPVETLKSKFCEYYRVTPQQFDILAKSENKLEFAILLKELGVIDQWKRDAAEGIKYLEKLTRLKFKNDSVKQHYTEPTPEQVTEFKRLKESGYYSDEAKIKRHIEELNKKAEAYIKEIDDKLKELINKETEEKDLKIWLFKKLETVFGTAKALKIVENVIYYNHSKTIKFNWRDSNFYTKISKAEFKEFCDSLNKVDKLQLPEGIKFEFPGLDYGQPLEKIKVN